MNRLFITLTLVSLSFFSFAENYSIEAEYSSFFGFPIPDIEDKAITRFSTGFDLSSESLCVSQLSEGIIPKMALGEAAKAGATDVIIKCVKYWENANCDSIYSGCIGRADVGSPVHLHLYNEKTNVPEYLLRSDNQHQILQSVMYGAGEVGSSDLEVGLIAQVKYDKNLFSRILGGEMRCEQSIESPRFTELVRKTYFTDKRTKAYKFNCFNVSKSGNSTLVGERLIHNTEN